MRKEKEVREGENEGREGNRKEGEGRGESTRMPKSRVDKPTGSGSIGGLN